MAKEKKPKTSKDPEKSIKNKILQYLGLGTTKKALQSLVKRLAEELREWVVESPTGTTAEMGYQYRQTGPLGVVLQKTPSHKIGSEDLIKLLGFQAHQFLTVNRRGIIAAIEAGTLKITKQQLDEITTTTYGKDKIVAYVGPVEIVLPEEEAEEDPEEE